MQEAFKRRIMAAACSKIQHFQVTFYRPQTRLEHCVVRQAHGTQRQVASHIHPQALTAHEHDTHRNRCVLQHERCYKKPTLQFQPAH